MLCAQAHKLQIAANMVQPQNVQPQQWCVKRARERMIFMMHLQSMRYTRYTILDHMCWQISKRLRETLSPIMCTDVYFVIARSHITTCRAVCSMRAASNLHIWHLYANSFAFHAIFVYILHCPVRQTAHMYVYYVIGEPLPEVWILFEWEGNALEGWWHGPMQVLSNLVSGCNCKHHVSS